MAHPHYCLVTQKIPLQSTCFIVLYAYFIIGPNVYGRTMFITLSIHLCLRHDWRDAARRAGSSATSDNCSLVK